MSFFVSLLIFSLWGGSATAAGSFTIESDYPPYKAVSAGDTNAIIGILRVCASGESISLWQIELTMTAGFPDCLASRQVRIYDGVTQIGAAQFANNNANSHITATTSNVIVSVGVDKLFTLRADISPIGQGQLGTEGMFIKVDVRKNTDLPSPNGFSAVGQGQTSGEIIYTESVTNSPGIRTFKSVPTFTLDPLATSGLGDGKLLRFKVSAGSSGSVGVAKFTLGIVAQNTTVNNVNVFGFTDSLYTQPISGVSLDGRLCVVGQVPNFENEVNIFSQNGAGDQLAVQVPTGATYYFEVRGNTVSQGTDIKTVTTTIKGDLVFNQGGGMTTVAGTESDPNNNFIWSPNFAGVSSPADMDWSNGAGVSGLPSSGLSQIRVDDGQPLVLTVSATPNPAQIGEQVVWSVAVTGGTGVNSYEWQGSDGLSGNNQTVQTSYTISGAKYGIATVVSGTQIESAGASLEVATPTPPQDPPIVLSEIVVNPNPSFVSQTVSFLATATGGSGVYEYEWFVDGGSGGCSVGDSQVFSISGVFVIPKIYVVSIKVASGNAETQFTSAYVEVKDTPIPPLIISTITVDNQSPYLNDIVTFSTSTPTGGNGNYTFNWSIDGVVVQGNGVSMSHTFTTPGVKRVDLTIASGSQNATSSLLITVVGSEPTNSFFTYIGITASVIKVNVGQQIDWSFAIAADAYVAVNWGDDFSEELSPNNVFSHIYENVGNYVATFSIVSEGVMTNLAYRVSVEVGNTTFPFTIFPTVEWGNIDAIFAVNKNGLITAVENPETSKLFYRIRAKTGDKPRGSINYKLKSKRQQASAVLQE